ncbi:MAG: Hsp20/alpha crystallin family protein [Opitutales bacterium]|nr:Hsp20/alpha crystallin family protein [Opitutales bacterium]NRA27590.1 Hsp20/alpha crystallin family protein [Opitutales bacterium]
MNTISTDTYASDLATVSPDYQIIEKADTYQVSVDLPGVARDQINLKVEKGILELTAEQRVTIPTDARVLYRETRDRRYELALRLGESVDSKKIDATLENGRLRLELAKRESAKAAHIEVK